MRRLSHSARPASPARAFRSPTRSSPEPFAFCSSGRPRPLSMETRSVTSACG